ncbi:MAG: hypothetical protein GY835_23530, partial [bacterium]|nr:hypothetical protein [bacterium]
MKDLPEPVWKTLRDYEFGEGEEAVRMLREYLESAKGRNARFLEQLRQEGKQRQQLQDLNEVGGVLAQAKPIPSSAILLRQTLALITSHPQGYPDQAVKMAEKIQEVRAEDAQKVYYTLRQPDEEADQAKAKATMKGLFSSLHLHQVFPKLKTADLKAREVQLQLLQDEAADQPTAQLYGKNDVLPLNDWMPRNMDEGTRRMYRETLEMTEPQLQGFCTWIYRQYGPNVTPLQICVIMICWRVA